MNLLFIEDDEALAFVTKRALERRGHAVSWFESLAEARKHLHQLCIDHALLDLKVGMETSLSFIAEIQQAHGAIPIVLLTGYGSIATAVQAIKLGAVNYLTKPCSVEEILTAFYSESSEALPDGQDVQSPSLRRLEWEVIQKALNENDGNISATARQLRMHRRTLQRKLQKLPRS